MVFIKDTPIYPVRPEFVEGQMVYRWGFDRFSLNGWEMVQCIHFFERRVKTAAISAMNCLALETQYGSRVFRYCQKCDIRLVSGD